MTVDLEDLIGGDSSLGPEFDKPRVAQAGEGAQVATNPLQTQFVNFDEPEAEAPDPTAPTTTTSRGFVPVSQGSGGSSGGAASGAASGLINRAKKYLGTPYVWGGESPLGFDCSGFTQYVFKQFGVNLPRVSYQQGRGGRGVGKNDLRPGDLIFWDTSSRNNGADHVAIYIGGGKIIEANRPGTRVSIDNLAGRGGWWARRYLGGGGASGSGGSLGSRGRGGASAV